MTDNGVARDMLLDYGAFTLTGTLKAIEPLERPGRDAEAQKLIPPPTGRAQAPAFRDRLPAQLVAYGVDRMLRCGAFSGVRVEQVRCGVPCGVPGGRQVAQPDADQPERGAVAFAGEHGKGGAIHVFGKLGRRTGPSAGPGPETGGLEFQGQGPAGKARGLHAARNRFAQRPQPGFEGR